MFVAENFVDFLFAESKNLEKDFLVGSKEHISFSRLYAKVLFVAGYIQDQVGTGKNIPVISQNNLFFIISYLGVIKSGNVVVPIHPDMEKTELTHILETCECQCAFVSKELSLKIDLPFKVWNEQSLEYMVDVQDPILFPEIEEEDPTEILFTTHSSGLPKGVVLSHLNLEANTRSIIQCLHLTDQDRMLVVLPFYESYGLSLLHTHLRAGGSIVLHNTLNDLNGIHHDMKKLACTGFAGVPDHYQILSGKSHSIASSSLPRLRFVALAEGIVPPTLIRDFIKHLPHVSFFILFGMTEATALLSYLPPEYSLQKTGSIGKAMPGVILKIVNENDYSVPAGEYGEIIAHGENIMKGYFKNETLTGTTIRNGWLHTGQIGKLDEDGFLFLEAHMKTMNKPL